MDSGRRRPVAAAGISATRGCLRNAGLQQPDPLPVVGPWIDSVHAPTHRHAAGRARMRVRAMSLLGTACDRRQALARSAVARPCRCGRVASRMPMRRNACRFVLRASGCHQIADSAAPRHRPSVFDVQPDDLSTAGSCATALAPRHRTDSLARVEVSDRDDVPPGLRDPRAEARRTEAMLDPSAVDGVHEAAGQRAAVSRAVARDKPGDVGGHPRR